MGSYALAKQAVRTKLEAEWPSMPVIGRNEEPGQPWPRIITVDGKKVPQPWVFFEMIATRSRNHTVGRQGNIVSVMYGFIMTHVFVERGTGDNLATESATAIGEIFRDKRPYNAGDGCYVQCWAPHVDEGSEAAADSDIGPAKKGNWYRVTMMCPFEYWHKG